MSAGQPLSKPVQRLVAVAVIVAGVAMFWLLRQGSHVCTTQDFRQHGGTCVFDGEIVAVDDGAGNYLRLGDHPLSRLVIKDRAGQAALFFDPSRHTVPEPGTHVEVRAHIKDGSDGVSQALVSKITTK